MPRSAPTKRTSWPRVTNSSATAMPGNRCPPVPPPAMMTFMRFAHEERGPTSHANPTIYSARFARSCHFNTTAAAGELPIALLRAPADARQPRPLGARTDRLRRGARDVEQDAHGEQIDDERRAAEADERQRQPLGRQRAEHDAEVDQRLKAEHRGDAEAEITAERIAGAQRRPRAAP